MGKKSELLTYVLIILLIIVVTPIKSLFAVSAAPNESMIVGTVVECAVTSSSVLNIKPEQTIYSITVNIESSEGMNKGPDFLSGRIGDNVRLFSKELLSWKLFGTRIKSRVSYQGDERGGRFWISDIELMGN